MIRDGITQLVCRLGIGIFQLSNFGTGVFIHFFRVERFQNRFCSVIFCKQVISVTAFPSGLQGRTISTESNQVVFPSHVIQTFGIAFTASLYLHIFGSTGLDSINGSSITGYGSGKNQFLIISNLAGHLLPFSIQYNNLCCIRQVQTVGDFCHRQLYHFVRALYSQRIGHRDGYSLALVTSKAKQSRHA